MKPRVRDLELQSGRLLKDLEDLVRRTKFAASPKRASDIEELIYEILGDSADIVERPIRLPSGEEALLFYFTSMVEERRIEETIIEPLSLWQGQTAFQLVEVEESGIFTTQVQKTLQGEEIIKGMLQGDAVLGFTNMTGAMVISVRQPKSRGVQDPLVEVLARGPRDSFTETAIWNIALVRRRLVDPNLRVIQKTVGIRSQTNVYILYLDDVVNRSALEELMRRIEQTRIDGILDSGMLEQLIEDNWWTPFPTFRHTERPDVVTAEILEGRIGIIVDNTPIALVAPITLDSLFHSPEDTYSRPVPVTLLRIVRFIASIITVTLPAVYIVVSAYHPALMPLKLATKIANSREGVAFPVLFEVLLMQLFLEILREAGFRLPGPIGQTFGIVGGIVIGELGVRSGLVSEMMVVVIALTALASFATPNLLLGTSMRLLGLPIMILSAVFGAFGFVIALCLLLAHLVSLRSLGVPYVLPYPFYPYADFKDTIFRTSLVSNKLRPTYLGPQQRWRLQDVRRDVAEPVQGHKHRSQSSGEDAKGEDANHD